MYVRNLGPKSLVPIVFLHMEKASLSPLVREGKAQGQQKDEGQKIGLNKINDQGGSYFYFEWVLRIL